MDPLAFSRVSLPSAFPSPSSAFAVNSLPVAEPESSSQTRLASHRYMLTGRLSSPFAGGAATTLTNGPPSGTLPTKVPATGFAVCSASSPSSSSSAAAARRRRQQQQPLPRAPSKVEVFLPKRNPSRRCEP